MHHCYFDPDKLTDAQRARWDWAIREYQVILDRNVERQMAHMSMQNKENLLQSFPMLRMGSESLDDDVRRVLRLFQGLSGGAEGDPRSALFARLLSGKPPLDRPPPSTFHHPWYEVIEDDGPFEVMVSDAHSQAPSLESGEATTLHGLCIDHCPWLVESMNEPAARLFEFQAQLDAMERRDQSTVHFEWTPQLIDNVTNALQDDPWLLVRFEEWPLYRLRLDQREADGDAPEFSRALGPDTLAGVDNVFDTRALRIGYRIINPAVETGGSTRHTWFGWLLEKRW